MKLGYYPGCSLVGSSREYDESIRAIAPLLDIELEEVPDWNCCGATAAHTMNRMLGLALPARILALAEAAGMQQLAVPCSACYTRLACTRKELAENDKLRQEISDIVEMPVSGKIEILNALELLVRFASDKLADKTVKPFDHKVACYYGCYLVRPPKVVNFDRVEDPQSMDDLLKKVGAQPLDWAHKVECCGAGFSVSRTDLVAGLCHKILDDAEKRGAEAIVVACPMCHTNLDLRRDAIDERAGKHYSMPVLYISQVIGLALGVNEKKLGLHRHNVPVKFEEPVASASSTQTAGRKAE